MTLDDLKKLATGKTLFRLDSVLSPKLVPVLYAVGLTGILLWAVNHLFLTFGSNFGNGLWGLLEIAVFGLLSIIVLRIACEALLVFFKAHETATDSVNRTRISSSLLDEVREAIHELADNEEDEAFTDPDDYLTPGTDPAPIVTPTGEILPPSHTVKRTAKRTSPIKPD